MSPVPDGHCCTPAPGSRAFPASVFEWRAPAHYRPRTESFFSVASFPLGCLPSVAGWRKGVLDFCFYGWVRLLGLLGFENSTASYMAKQVTETPTGGKLCGRLPSGSNADRKTRQKDRLLQRNFLEENFSRWIDSRFS